MREFPLTTYRHPRLPLNRHHQTRTLRHRPRSGFRDRRLTFRTPHLQPVSSAIIRLSLPSRNAVRCGATRKAEGPWTTSRLLVKTAAIWRRTQDERGAGGIAAPQAAPRDTARQR